ncbi:endogenous retrovirus group K member 5 Gag polyprotein-like [Alexandromys fortis]|uniref:endogenous retrovirus group K member 5 Gag polyprotein-like n=1 Tax=Alexandromys fortis TaxID=100897 RepID=UPI00215244E3|nr:endogenous retrovirus group K member 5 Gag polyprotein-like [Microtus fortis]
MSDNITVPNFNSLFECAMWEILQEVSSTPHLWILLGLVVFLGIKWFDDKSLIESLRDESRILKAEVEHLQTIKHDNDLLKNQFKVLQEENRTLFNKTMVTEKNLEKVQADIKEKFITMEEGTADLNRKFHQSLSEGTETLSQRIKSVEWENQLLSKAYDRVVERLSIQEGTVYAIKIMSKDENLSLTDKLHTLESSMRALEHNSGQEIQTLQKAMVNRIEKIEEFLNSDSDEEEQTVERKILTTSVGKSLRDNFHKSLSTPLPAFPVITTEKVIGSKNPRILKEDTWEPVRINDLKEIKQAVTAFGMHSSFVKEMLKSWAIMSRPTPLDWTQMTSAVLESGTHLRWKCLFRQEARLLEQQEKAKGSDISLDKILGEGLFSDPQEQANLDESILSICTTAALRAWDRVQDPGQRMESFVTIKQGQREPFSDFLQRLTKAVQIGIPDPDTRRIMIESLAYENANVECKKILGPLRFRSAPLEEWVLHTLDVDTFDYGTEAWVEEAISNGKRRHQNTKCFNCGKMGHMRRNCKQRTFRNNNNASSRNNRNRRTQPSGLCRRCGKGRHWTNECRSTRDRQGNLIQTGNVRGGASQAPMANMVQSFPVSAENVPRQDN